MTSVKLFSFNYENIYDIFFRWKNAYKFREKGDRSCLSAYFKRLYEWLAVLIEKCQPKAMCRYVELISDRRNVTTKQV